MKKHEIIHLSKGGLVVDTSIGAIQLGAPPETIKDSLTMGRQVPELYIAPKNLFSHKKMLSIMDIEFPCNYNFFILKKMTVIFCTKEQQNIIRDLLKEAIIGPDTLNLEIEYPGGANNKSFPKMLEEMRYFRQHPVHGNEFFLDDIAEFHVFDENNELNYKGMIIKLDEESNIIKISDKDSEFELPWDIDYSNTDHNDCADQEIFIPPSFGVTTLGSSHGFDPKGKTSGFIFWINGIGVMVDPPVDSAIWLIEQNVDPKMVNSVILTHCHSDHDSGVMQKVLLEGRVKLYTTSTIFNSFMRKASLLTGLSIIEIVELIDFIPVTINEPININGASVIFKYRLHSIPTIGFEVSFRGKNVVYTSDHFNDCVFFKKLHDKNILTDGRYEDLSSFDWNKDMIIHEAGVPPLHTPIDTLLKLPYEYKKNIYLVHTDKDKIPANSGLKISPTGLSNTIVIEKDHTIHGESIEILNILTHLDMFIGMPLDKGAEFLSIINYVKFKQGDCLIKQGENNRKFYIIIAGKGMIYEDGVPKAMISSGSYFGETSIIQDNLAHNTVIALTDIITISIEKQDFLLFISNTSLYEKLNKLGAIRKSGSWEVINSNIHFGTLTINQKNNLESLFTLNNSIENETVIEPNNYLDFSVFWNEGLAQIIDKDNNVIKEITKGSFIGNFNYLVGENKTDFSLISKGKGSYFTIESAAMMDFLKQNPKILLDLKDEKY